MRENDDGVQNDGWVERAVRIKRQDGWRSVPGLVNPTLPDVAVTCAVFGSFDVTHLPTGKRVLGPYETWSLAAAAATRLTACFDLTGDDEAALKAARDAVADAPVPFGSFTMTRREWVLEERMHDYGESIDESYIQFIEQARDLLAVIRENGAPLPAPTVAPKEGDDGK